MTHDILFLFLLLQDIQTSNTAHELGEHVTKRALNLNTNLIYDVIWGTFLKKVNIF